MNANVNTPASITSNTTSMEPAKAKTQRANLKGLTAEEKKLRRNKQKNLQKKDGLIESAAEPIILNQNSIDNRPTKDLRDLSIGNLIADEPVDALNNIGLRISASTISQLAKLQSFTPEVALFGPATTNASASLLPTAPARNGNTEVALLFQNLVLDDSEEVAQPENVIRQRRSAEELVQSSGNSIEPVDRAEIDNAKEEFVEDWGRNNVEVAQEVEEEDPQEIAKLLYDAFEMFHGCSEEEHTRALEEHIAAARGNHYTLEETYQSIELPSVLDEEKIAKPVQAERALLASAKLCDEMFCGRINGQSRRRKNICLHATESKHTPAALVYDIDSFLGFASSLGVAKQGLYLCPKPSVMRNIQTNLHITLNCRRYANAEEDEQLQTVRQPIKDVPHIYLGHLEGMRQVVMYVLFPNLREADENFQGLKEEELAKWSNLILIPAMHQVMPAHILQHFPASWQLASAGALAKKAEVNKVFSVEAKQEQSIHYLLQEEYLEDLWASIEEIIENSPRLVKFSKPRLFLSAKNTKLLFKSSTRKPALEACLLKFLNALDQVVNTDYINGDTFFVDVAKETCNQTHGYFSKELEEQEEPQVLLWRTCCLKKNVEWLYASQSQPPVHNLFNTAFLRDASSLTVETPLQSKHYQQGLRYCQFYSSHKEIFDANKIFPFANDALEELALDEQLFKSAANAGGGPKSSRDSIQKSYQASKSRMHIGLKHSTNKSFGVREEYRMSLNLYFDLLETCREQKGPNCANTLAPRCVWSLPTAKYHDFLWHSVNRFAYGFESCLIMARPEYISWEETRMMAMFLQCLRYCASSYQLQRESALWWSEHITQHQARAEQPKTYRGLGFKNTMAKYGYCWMESVIDWQSLRFRPEIRSEMLFGSNLLQSQYIKRWKSVKNLASRSMMLDNCANWLRQYPEDTIRSWIFHLMIDICIQAFQEDIFKAIEGDLKPKYQRRMRDGYFPLSKEGIQQATGNRVHLSAGNKSKCSSPRDMYKLLWGYKDKQMRKTWENKAYRTLYQQAEKIVGSCPDSQTSVDVWSEVFFENLGFYCYLFPMPEKRTFIPTNHEGLRMWWSIVPLEDGDSEPEPKSTTKHSQWRWGRKKYQEGLPARLREYVLMPDDEIIRLLEEKRRALRQATEHG
ncbi:MAG: hypothetical protein M1829_002461 [Trizodia sp. TS-e1964]|nr:MAG: hypothetical protein M1829_002461 [Trizodia sp. TS-e1964]